MPTRLVVGNWKMHGSLARNEALIHELKAAISAGAPDVAVCVPFPYLAQLQGLLTGSEIRLGAQDVSEHVEGAYTGQVSAMMLSEFGCEYVIVGHSERRASLGEHDEMVARKAAAALNEGLSPIVCVGETLAEREAGRVETVLERQLDAVDRVIESSDKYSRLVIAYEPVWAIGTGRSASTGQIAQVCDFIRGRIGRRGPVCAETIRLLYGGSVKPETAAELFALKNVDGGLIGGASLKAKDFAAICRSAASL